MRLPVPLVALNAAVLVAGMVAAGSPQVREATAVLPAAADVPRPAATPTVTEAVRAAVPTPAAAPSTTLPTTPAAAPPTAAKAPAPAAAPTPVQRTVTRTGWRPYATVGPVTLHFPGDVVEVVGLHQSGHDGAQPQQPVKGTGRIGLLDSRQRDTHRQGAADVVVDPTRPVRAPVTGTVVRAGTYTLYCDHVDHYVVIEPDARPGWEVKVLHFEGLAVGPSDRVQAGVTVVGSRARVLPFASQVDEHTAAPHWPHLHIEVVDPAVRDRPSGGGCR